MTTSCPRCHSAAVITYNRGRKTGGAIGTVAGGVSGAVSAARGARMGSSLGAIAGPAGSIAGAVIGSLFGGVAGCTVGSTLGDMVDENILNNYHCLHCNYRFNWRKQERPALDSWQPGSFAHEADDGFEGLPQLSDDTEENHYGSFS